MYAGYSLPNDDDNNDDDDDDDDDDDTPSKSYLSKTFRYLK
jgi:hypothetical protein